MCVLPWKKIEIHRKPIFGVHGFFNSGPSGFRLNDVQIRNQSEARAAWRTYWVYAADKKYDNILFSTCPDSPVRTKSVEYNAAKSWIIFISPAVTVEVEDQKRCKTSFHTHAFWDRKLYALCWIILTLCSSEAIGFTRSWRKRRCWYWCCQLNY